MIRHGFALMLALLFTGAACAAARGADGIDVVPRPNRVEPLDGRWGVTGGVVLVPKGMPEVRAIGERAAAILSQPSGVAIDVQVNPGAAATVSGVVLALRLDAQRGDLGNEGYELRLTHSSSERLLTAATPAGLFRGVQTLAQIMASPANVRDAESAAQGAGDATGAAGRIGVSWPCCVITDSPRFAHRGMLLDCCRHFWPKEFVKRTIDLLAYHRMNVLHWHLTEDQGWRIEIKKYPKLTEIGAWRRAVRDTEQPRDEKGRYGGFYTQDDIREIVAYARERYVTVIPEIELPGHALAALAAYPELSCAGGPFRVGTQWGVYDDVYCAGNDRTVAFLEDVLSEVVELFPSAYIHIGGDECPKSRWEACSRCQARIEAEGLENAHELQSWLIRRIEKFLNGKGRRLIGWDEILEGGLAPNATVQSWRGLDGAIAAATSGHDVICSPTSHCYLDYAQGLNPGEPIFMGFIPLETVYSFEPMPPQLSADQARHVLGVEGNMWTEHAPSPALVDRQVFPRLCAIAEVAWTSKARRDWGGFQRRMTAHYRRLDALGVQYYIGPPGVVISGKPAGDATFEDRAEVTIKNAFPRGDVFYTLDGGEPTTASTKYTAPIALNATTRVMARTILENGRLGMVGSVRLRRLAAHEPVRRDGAKPGLAYRVAEGDWQSIPDFGALKPVAAGVADSSETSPFALEALPRKELFAAEWTGLMTAPRDGTYTFHLLSDDGSRLWIADDLVVDLDGRHGPTEKSGEVILKAGAHPIRVAYFQWLGAAWLEVGVEGPQMPRRPLSLDMLSHIPS